MADEDFFDYGDDQLKNDDAVGDSGVVALSALVTKLSQVDIEVARAEDQLSKLKEQQKELREKRIPDLMLELGASEFATESGLRVKIVQKVSAKITDTTRAKAIQWLKDNNFERMVKNEFTLKLDKGEMEKAGKLVEAVEALGLPYKSKPNVHHSSLSAFVKQRDAAGESVPDDLFNVYRVSQAKIG